ncbi:MAG: NAD-dependent epimerase/dehydratase family protein [Bdellovibrionaceae bacterium]|jgi:nucleoside-diphosphate-sugar epimerase|nr:NAD-dependent epimerase/dehydratase family protein [Pseudobdellovibrionaceae bacterium]
MNVLILGGNRFFGKKLTARLLEKNHTVTLLNRGNVDDGFADRVSRIKCDRNDKEAFDQAIAGQSWDVVYDQICFDFDMAKTACDVFYGKTKRYIFTSSKSVYKPGENLREADFDPSKHLVDKLETSSSNYAEAKRQAEVGFYRYAKFPVVSVRFPIVIGHDDYTERFKFHIKRIKNKQPIYFPNLDANITFITSDFAAEVLTALFDSSFEGPLNAASFKPIKLRRFIEIIENHVGEKMISTDDESEEFHSPYGIDSDWFMNSEGLLKLGLKGEEIEAWLPKMLG